MYQDRAISANDFCNIPTSVLRIMTKGEVAEYVKDRLSEAAALNAWNSERDEPIIPAEPIGERNPAPPKSMDEYNWRVRSRR
jgi:hypothetical protein